MLGAALRSVLVFVLAVGFSAESLATPKWRDYQTSVAEKKITKPRSILSVHLSYDSDKQPALRIMNLHRMSGYVPNRFNQAGAYRLELVDATGKVLHSLGFSVPNRVTIPLPEKGAPTGQSETVLPRVEFVLNLPDVVGATQIRIFDPDGQMIMTEDLKSATPKQIEPKFHSIPGDEFQKSSRNERGSLKGAAGHFFSAVAALTSLFIEDVSAASGDGRLDVTFVGDKYLTTADLSIFHNDVNRMIAQMLKIEPFRSRSSQIYFHYVDNTSSLGCYYSATIARLLLCNNSAVSAVVNAAGAPYDQIIVLVNSATYGGSGTGGGGPISVAYNGSSGPLVSAHEFGHSFGALVDEYNLASANGTLSNIATKNQCYAGVPPNLGWAGLVAPGDYRLGCNYPNWYRSSASSLMLALGSPYFNTMSQLKVGQRFDALAAPFTDNISPTAAITSPTDGGYVTGTVTVQATLTDNQGIARAELLRDGELYQTVYQAPFTFSWNTSGEASGPHRLAVRAYDVAGNMGESVVGVTVAGGGTTPTPVPIVLATPTPLPTPVPSVVRDLIAPTIAIIYPLPGALISTRNLSIQVDARDNIAVTSVEIYLDGALVTRSTTIPFTTQFNVRKVSTGMHVLSARAYDAAGNVGVSAATSILK